MTKLKPKINLHLFGGFKRIIYLCAMAKDKNKEAEYKAEGLKRMKIRKEKRLEKFTQNRAFRKRSTCRGCGEDPYCYCGDGTPYSY